MRKIGIVLTLLALLSTNSFAKLDSKIVKQTEVKTFEDKENVFKSGDFFMTRQPNLEDLRWYKSQGVKKIINLRSNSEVEKFTKSAFDEEKMAIELGLKYVNIPIGSKDDYSPEMLSQFKTEVEKTGESILIHCASAGRVTYFMMAYLIKEKGFSREEAITFGSKLKYTSYLDLLIQ